eukprot:7471828-Ditylum_brightwellii.AAC.1
MLCDVEEDNDPMSILSLNMKVFSREFLTRSSALPIEHVDKLYFANRWELPASHQRGMTMDMCNIAQ